MFWPFWRWAFYLFCVIEMLGLAVYEILLVLTVKSARAIVRATK